MKNLLNRIKKWRNISFVKDTAVMQGGMIVSTLMGIAVSILMARFLLPDQYGTYRVVYSFAGIILLFLSWGVENATAIALSEEYSKKNKEGIKNIITYFFKTNFYIIIMAFFAILVAPFLSEKLYGSKEIGYLARIVILGGVFGVVINLTNTIFQIKRKVKEAVFFDFFKDFIRVALSLGALFLGFEVAGVLKGQFLATLLAFLAMIFIYIRCFSNDELFPKIKEIIFSFKLVKIRKYFNFGILISLDKNVSALYSLLPVFFLGIFCPTEQVAYLNIALKYITLPLILLSPVARLLDIRLPQMTAEEDAEKLKRNFYKVSFVSGAIGSILVVPALILAPFLINIFYGEAYAKSIYLVYYLAPLPIFLSFAVGLGSIFRALNKLKEIFVINSALVVFGIFPVYLSIKNFGVIGMIISYIVWINASNIVSFLYIKKFLK